MAFRDRYDFTDEEGEPITITYKDKTGFKRLLTKLKNWLIRN